MATATFTAAALGIAAQLFISPIPEVSTIKVLEAYFIANCVLLWYLLVSKRDIATVIIDHVFINFVFLSTACLLTAIRRLYFSPLSKFPGPKFAALTKLWDANEFRLGRAVKTRTKLHAQYGDFVRIGPNEVSVNNVDAVSKLYKGKYIRGPFYEYGILNIDMNLNTVRDYKYHGPWRRIWEKAFVSAEFVDYNPRVEYHVGKLLRILGTKARQKKEVDFSKLMDNLVFDIMADLSFAHDSGMQDGTGDALYLGFIHKFMSVLSVVSTLRNFCQLLPYLPESAEVKSFRLLGEKMLAERQKLGGSRRDIFRHLLAEDSDTRSGFTQTELNANANLIIVAGADTASTVMTRTFRALAQEPAILKKLREEIENLCGEDTPLTVESTTNLPYLNAVVNEALRVFNPVSSIQATTAPGGVEICGVYLPGGIQAAVPIITLMTDERYFPQGDKFIPERWTAERPELLLERHAYIPFGYGVHSCVGRQLALNEMRLTIASVVKDFDLAFGESYDGARFDDEMKNHVVMKLGELSLTVHSRH